MPAALALPVTPLVTEIANLAAFAPVKSLDLGSADSFLALLNTSGNLTGDNAGQNDSSAPTQNQKQDQNTPTPPAVPMDAPLPIAAAPPPQKTPALPQPVTNNAPANNSPNNSPLPQNTAPPPAKGTNANNTQGASSQATPAPTVSPATAAGQGSAGNSGLSEQQIRSALQGQLGDISQILQAMIQAMGGGTSTTTASVASTTTASNAAATSANASATELALLQSIEALVQQMQQALQPSTGQGQNGGGNGLQTLTNLFAADVGKLSQLLTPQAGSDNTASLLTFNTPQLGDLGTQLKNSIAQVRDQLQNLQNSNDALFAQMTASLKDTLTSNAQSLKNTLSDAAKGNDPAVTVAQGVTVTPSVPVVPVNPSLAVQPLATAGIAQNGADNAGSGNSGNNGNNGQGQSAPAPVIGAGVSQPAAGVGVNNLSFSKLLDQAASAPTLLNQVTFNVKTALDDGSSKIHIQLEPADLGKLDIRLDVGADGKTGVTITADNQSTLDLLKRDTQGLAQALTDAGLSADAGSLSFSLGGQQGQGNSQAALTYQKTQPEEDDPTTVNTISRSYVVNLAEGNLDITI